MRLPTRVIVGYRKIKIKKAKLGEDYGVYKGRKHEILIDKNQRDTELQNTLLHEIIHAVWDLADLKEGDTEEKIVTLIANGLSQVFLNNPTVFKFFQTSLNN